VSLDVGARRGGDGSLFENQNSADEGSHIGTINRRPGWKWPH